MVAQQTLIGLTDNPGQFREPPNTSSMKPCAAPAPDTTRAEPEPPGRPTA
jgi:hypothetical protein